MFLNVQSYMISNKYSYLIIKNIFYMHLYSFKYSYLIEP